MELARSLLRNRPGSNDEVRHEHDALPRTTSYLPLLVEISRKSGDIQASALFSPEVAGVIGIFRARASRRP